MIRFLRQIKFFRRNYFYKKKFLDGKNIFLHEKNLHRTIFTTKNSIFLRNKMIR